MTKLLHLDKLLPEPAAVVLRGKEYPVIAQSVEAALSFLKHREELVAMAGAEADPVKLIESNIKVIAMACPAIEPELLGLPLPALMKLIEFMTAELGLAASDEDEEGAEGEAEEG